MSWIDETDLGLSPNEKEDFTKVMGDFKSLPEALIGGYNAKKVVGKPFKLPESLDKLPSDDIKKEFTEKARGLLGIESPVTEDSIKEVNFSKGLSEGKQVDEGVKSKLSEFAIKEGLPVSKVQNMVELLNSYGEEIGSKSNEEYESTLKESARITKEKADQYFGADKVPELTELTRRYFQNDKDLSEKEKEDILSDLTEEGYIGRRFALMKYMFEKVAPLAKEGDTPNNKLNASEKKATITDELPLSSEALGWK